MMLTTKGRYAVTSIIEIASRGGASPVSLSEISSAKNISINYLERIFLKLKQAGIVSSVRGPGGGYSLALPLEKIRISDVIDAVGENIEMTGCYKKGKKPSCKLGTLGTKCETHDLWKGLGDNIRNYFDGISLKDLVIKDERDLLGP